MQYPIGKTMLIACFALAGAAFGTKTITGKTHPNSEPGVQAAVVTPAPAPTPSPATTGDLEHSAAAMYNELDLASNGMKEEVFETALRGLDRLSDEGKIERQDKITIV